VLRPTRWQLTRLPHSEHTSRPWRIHELTPDFRLEDVRELPTPGGADDFPLLVGTFAHGKASGDSSRAVRLLWAIRWRLGKLFGLDDPSTGIGARVPTLCERLPADLRDGSRGPELESLPFRPLFLLKDEWAAEIANRTIHGVLHLGWVPDTAGGYRGQMAVLVKPNGPLGLADKAMIKPFRYLVVYPAMLRTIRWEWQLSRCGTEAA